MLEIKVEPIGHIVHSDPFDYDYRVIILAGMQNLVYAEIRTWLWDNKIPFIMLNINTYYLSKKHAEFLMLKWS